MTQVTLRVRSLQAPSESRTRIATRTNFPGASGKAAFFVRVYERQPAGATTTGMDTRFFCTDPPAGPVSSSTWILSLPGVRSHTLNVAFHQRRLVCSFRRVIAMRAGLSRGGELDCVTETVFAEDVQVHVLQVE